MRFPPLLLCAAAAISACAPLQVQTIEPVADARDMSRCGDRTVASNRRIGVSGELIVVVNNRFVNRCAEVEIQRVADHSVIQRSELLQPGETNVFGIRYRDLTRAPAGAVFGGIIGAVVASGRKRAAGAAVGAIVGAAIMTEAQFAPKVWIVVRVDGAVVAERTVMVPRVRPRRVIIDLDDRTYRPRDVRARIR